MSVGTIDASSTRISPLWGSVRFPFFHDAMVDAGSPVSSVTTRAALAARARTHTGRLARRYESATDSSIVVLPDPAGPMIVATCSGFAVSASTARTWSSPRCSAGCGAIAHDDGEPAASSTSFSASRMRCEVNFVESGTAYS